jgi:hypothetical protein
MLLLMAIEEKRKKIRRTCHRLLGVPHSTQDYHDQRECTASQGGRDQGGGYSSEKVHKIIMIKENAPPHRW